MPIFSLQMNRFPSFFFVVVAISLHHSFSIAADSTAAAQAGRASPPPNVITLLVDDLGYRDLGFDYWFGLVNGVQDRKKGVTHLFLSAQGRRLRNGRYTETWSLSSYQQQRISDCPSIR